MSWTIEHVWLLKPLLYVVVYLWLVLFFAKLLPDWIAKLRVKVAKKKLEGKK